MRKRWWILILTALIILSGCVQTRTEHETCSIPETVTDSQKDGIIIQDSLDPDKELANIQIMAEKVDESAETEPKQKTVEQVISEAESSDEQKPEMDQENGQVNDQVNEQVDGPAEPDEAADPTEEIMEIEVPEPELMDEHNDPDPESTDSSDLEVLSEPETESELESESTAVTEPESEMDTESETVITQPESETNPEPESEPEPETVTEYESAFDIDYWVSYAYSLAAWKGLNLDPSATDCWDNPIMANSDCIYLERDLNNRLDRYAGDEGITDVWIWYEDLGEGRYLIYIGYA